MYHSTIALATSNSVHRHVTFSATKESLPELSHCIRLSWVHTSSYFALLVVAMGLPCRKCEMQPGVTGVYHLQLISFCHNNSNFYTYMDYNVLILEMAFHILQDSRNFVFNFICLKMLTKQNHFHMMYTINHTDTYFNVCYNNPVLLKFSPSSS